MTKIGAGEVAQHQRVRVSMVNDLEIDGSHQLSSLCFDFLDNSHAKCESLTCSSQCYWLVQRRPCHVLSHDYVIMHVKDP